MGAHIEVASMVVRVLLCLSLMACGDEAYAQHLGGDSGIHGSTGGGSGVAADPTPIFDWNPGLGSSYDNLTAPAGFTTQVLCLGETATTTSQICTTGGTFTEAGGDISVGLPAPYTDELARSTDHDRFYSYRAPNNTLAEVTSGVEFILEIDAFTIDRAATQYIIGKYDTANSQGYAIRVTAGGVVQGVANATTFGSHQIDVMGEWNHYAISRINDVCGLYVNGQLSGSTAACSGTLATVAVAKPLEIGCRPGTGSNQDCIDGKVAYWRMLTATASGLTAADVALQQYLRLDGLYPTSAVTSLPVATDIRSTRAALDITRGGVRRIFRVGASRLRNVAVAEVTPDKRSGGRVIRGYLSETTTTNLMLRSREFDNAAWTDLTGADSFDADNWASPMVDQNEFEADRLSAALDVVGVEHGSRQSVTLTATDYAISVFFGYDATAPTTKLWGFIRDNTLGATAIGYFDIVNCVPGTGGAGLKQIAAGKYGNIHTQDYGTHNSTQQFCRATIIVVGTAAAHDIDIGFADSDGDTTFTTTAAEKLGTLWGAQVEAMQSGVIRPGTSFIMTTSATQERLYDGLRFPIANVPSTGTLVWEAMLPWTKVANVGSSPSNPAGWIATPYKDSSNYIHLKATQGTGQGIFGGVASAGGGLYANVITAGVDEMECCSQSGFGQFYASVAGLTTPGSNLRHNFYDGRLHRARMVYDTTTTVYFDGDSLPGATATSVALPSLTGGRLEIGYSATDGSSASHASGPIQRVRFWDSAVEPEFP